MKLWKIAELVNQYVVSFERLPARTPDNCPIGRSKLTTFNATVSELRAFENIPAFEVGNTYLSNALCPNAVDTLPSGHSIGWSLYLPSMVPADIKPEKHYIPTELLK